MRSTLEAKFNQHPDLATKLDETGDVELVEGNTWGDVFWGVDVDTGQGENHLGRLLMELRSTRRAGGMMTSALHDRPWILAGLGRSIETLVSSQLAIVFPRTNQTVDVTLNMVVFAEDPGVLDVSLRRVVRHTRSVPIRLWIQAGCTPEVRKHCKEFASGHGNTDVVISRKNIGHGPALDRLWEMCETPYFLCFDMDSFPVADGWLEDLEAKLDAGASCAGVIERAVGRRNKWGEYVHPSCFLIGKDEFESLRHPRHGLRFGGFSPTRADVGEMITIQIMRTGRKYSGWGYTHSRFPDEVQWGFRYYGGYWCHIWMVSQLVGQKRWHGQGSEIRKCGMAWVYDLYGVTPERYAELMAVFLVENG